jgi:hypothetical protein
MLLLRSSNPRIASTAAIPSILVATALLLHPMLACNSASSATPQNFITGLNRHFLDHPDCLFPDSPTFPYETTDPVRTAQMNTLVTAKLLTVAVERDIHASRYTPTDAGARVAPRFCYGHRIATAIDSFTPPAPANGFTETQVTYHYRLEEIPVWARSADMRAAFPAMGLATSGDATGKATLADNITGWQVPD